jgi:SAM-dependent methyltransferase
VAQLLSAPTSHHVAIEERERGFHDEWAASIDISMVPVKEAFTGSTSPEGAWIMEQLGNLKGRRLLELGSGAGEGAVFFAMQGADVTATDLSPGMLEVVQKLAVLHGTSVQTAVVSADDLSKFPNESFDVVYGANLLHHIDIARCLDEVWRVLKLGGRAAFWDPVAYNPAINVYRKMASDVRTIDEHPIRRSDLARLRAQFSDVKVRFFWLTALLIFLKFYLIDRIHPSADRYWKLIVTEEEKLRSWVKPLMAFDRFLLGAIPCLGWLCWNIAVVVRK